jgi:hypothetical protein
LAIFKKFTWQEIGQVFAFCAFPAHVYTIYNLLEDIPNWYLYMDLWRLAGIISYSLIFALIESIALFLIVFAVGLLIPKRVLKDNFVPLSGIFILEATGFAMLLHLMPELFMTIRRWVKAFYIGVLISLPVLYFIEPIKKAVRFVLDRLSILSFAYVGIDLIAIIIVIIRNV